MPKMLKMSIIQEKKIFPVVGRSMSMVMDPGDQAIIKFCPIEEICAGDIAVLLRWAGKSGVSYVTHRVILNIFFRDRRFLLTRGDAVFFPDLPFSSFQPV